MSYQIETKLVITDAEADVLVVEIYHGDAEGVKFNINGVYLTEDDADALYRFLDEN